MSDTPENKQSQPVKRGPKPKPPEPKVEDKKVAVKPPEPVNGSDTGDPTPQVVNTVTPEPTVKEKEEEKKEEPKKTPKIEDKKEEDKVEELPEDWTTCPVKVQNVVCE